LTMRLTLPKQKYPTAELRQAFYNRLDERLAGLSGVQSGTFSTSIPTGGGPTRQLLMEGRPETAGQQPPVVTVVSIGPRYFETIGVQLSRGRLFDGSDGTAGHDAVIVNQRFAVLHFGGEDPIGRRIKLVADGAALAGPAPTWVTIVGISPSIRQRFATEAEPDPVAYLPFRIQAPASTALIIRSAHEPATLTSMLREEVRSLDPDLPVFDIRTMDQQLAQQRWALRIFGSMFAIFAVIALALSAVGLYAVTAYSVSQRTQEIGVRMVLGAQASQVQWLILRRSVVHLAIGLALGIGGAWGVGRLLDSVLVQSGSRELITLTSIVALLVVVSMLASYWPARRATQLDPVSALRNE
jgi:putative ABC transport system permease protein